MKAFPSIITKLFYEPVLITPAKHSAIWQVVSAHMAGQPIVSQMQSGEGDDESSEDYRQVEDIAIIPVHGVIGRHLEKMASASPGCDLELLDGMIDTAEYDSSVSRVVYDFRTPGGAANGVPETAAKILRSSKETIGFFDQECDSGGAWLASQCKRLYGTASGSFGSIGVWCAYLDISRQMLNDGENMQAISAGKYKLMGAYWKALTDEEKGILQAKIDKIYSNFKTAMNSVRQCSEENMGNGLIFDGEEAAARGLTDGVVESLDELLDDLLGESD